MTKTGKFFGYKLELQADVPIRFEMQLELMTWKEVEAYLENQCGILLPVGSIEQHGPMGLIGTDALCAEAIANESARRLEAMVAPAIRYTPAPFNMAFPGTMSLSESTFTQMVQELILGLASQGFSKIYILNGHGANLAPVRSIMANMETDIRLKSWWDFPKVQKLRQKFYGEWEGMHATPSEVAITRYLHRIVEPGEAIVPPEKLSAEYIKAHSGDKHGPPSEHRETFPDGRVGSHSALATQEHGEQLLKAAVEGVVEDFRQFTLST